METSKKYLSGCLSGFIATSIFHPIDVLRIRLFFDLKSLGRFPILYHGITFNVLTGCLKNMVVYPTQEYLRDKLIKYQCDKYTSELFGSLGTGISLSLAGTPINVIKIPLQADVQNRTVFFVMKDIYSKYGFRGFYRGGLGTFMRDISWITVYFPLFRYFGENVTENKILASIMAGIPAMTVSYPFDGLRLYRQNNKENYHFWTGFKKSFNLSSGNLKSYMVSLLRVPTMTTFSHMSYLYISQYLTTLK
jgi:Mitochondrial carrier protein